MSCGLGAIVLVFMLVKDTPDRAVPEAAVLETDLSRLEQLHEKLRGDIQAVHRRTTAAGDRIPAVSRDLSRIRQEAQRSREAASARRERLAALEKAITKTRPTARSDVIDIPKAGRETYLIGLKVEGRKIGILVDSSASMTDETLLAIIRRKNGSDAEKRAGPKWRRTREIVRWLLARQPGGAQVSVVAYSDKARHLGGGKWVPGRDPGSLEPILRDLEAIVPSGPTNLEAGLEAMYAMGPTNLYVVTDGLPTLGSSDYRRLGGFGGCSALWSGSYRISGECRARLFRHTTKGVRPPSGMRINVILLPIEGDPGAAPEYWAWTAESGGLLITPAETWP